MLLAALGQKSSEDSFSGHNQRSHRHPVAGTDALNSEPRTLNGRNDIDPSSAGAARIAAAASSKSSVLLRPEGTAIYYPARRSTHRPRASGPIASTTFEIPIVTLDQASPRPDRGSGTMDGDGTDETPIAPTTSLVELFEKSNHGTQGRHTVSPAASKSQEKTPTKPQAVRPESKISPRLEAMRHRQQYDEAVAAEAAAHELRGRPAIQGQLSFKRSSSATDAAGLVSTLPPVLKEKPALPPPRRATAKPIPAAMDEPLKWPKSQSPTPPRPQPLHLRKTSSNLSLPEAFSRSSLSPNPNHYQQRSIRQISPHITGDSLANAIVGASLASRQTSPHRAGTPSSIPPTRNSKHQHHGHNPLQHFRTRSNSPVKSNEGGPQRVSLRTTLRREESSSSDEGRGKQGKGRKHRFRKHPNKHHEGDRKRWRDTITDRERRRYEGLWAANKGLCIEDGGPLVARRSSASSTTGPGEDVLDLVVREIWSRSRLPSHVLAEIWDLVDHRREHRLSREEFVVGTWLVDQCLKGRKVPSRVMDSVWMSVKLLGVKVRKKNFQ